MKAELVDPVAAPDPGTCRCLRQWTPLALQTLEPAVTQTQDPIAIPAPVTTLDPVATPDPVFEAKIEAKT